MAAKQVEPAALYSAPDERTPGAGPDQAANGSAEVEIDTETVQRLQELHADLLGDEIPGHLKAVLAKARRALRKN